MSIKIVNEIPKPKVNKDPKGQASEYRPKLYADLIDAFMQGISKFEFVGYDTKPDYLAQAARDEAFKVCETLVWKPAREYAKETLSKEFPSAEKILTHQVSKYSPNHIIQIHGVTLDDGVKHIYGEINFSKAVQYRTTCLEISRERTEERVQRDQRDLLRGASDGDIKFED